MIVFWWDEFLQSSNNIFDRKLGMLFQNILVQHRVAKKEKNSIGESVRTCNFNETHKTLYCTCTPPDMVISTKYIMWSPMGPLKQIIYVCSPCLPCSIQSTEPFWFGNKMTKQNSINLNESLNHDESLAWAFYK